MATLDKSMKSTCEASHCKPSTWSSISTVPCNVQKWFFLSNNKIEFSVQCILSLEDFNPTIRQLVHIQMWSGPLEWGKRRPRRRSEQKWNRNGWTQKEQVKTGRICQESSEVLSSLECKWRASPTVSYQEIKLPTNPRDAVKIDTFVGNAKVQFQDVHKWESNFVRSWQDSISPTTKSTCHQKAMLCARQIFFFFNNPTHETGDISSFSSFHNQQKFCEIGNASVRSTKVALGNKTTTNLHACPSCSCPYVGWHRRYFLAGQARVAEQGWIEGATRAQKINNENCSILLSERCFYLAVHCGHDFCFKSEAKNVLLLRDAYLWSWWEQQEFSIWMDKKPIALSRNTRYLLRQLQTK